MSMMRDDWYGDGSDPVAQNPERLERTNALLGGDRQRKGLPTRRSAAAWARVALSPTPTTFRDKGPERLPGMGHGAGTQNMESGRFRRLQEDVMNASNRWYYAALQEYKDYLSASTNRAPYDQAELTDIYERFSEMGDEFGIGQQRIPDGADPQAIYQRDPARSLDGVAVKDLEATIRNMNEDQLTRLQLRMDKAGFYGEGRPVLGRFTFSDKMAMQEMFREALFRGSNSFTELLDEKELENEAAMIGQFSDEVLGIDTLDASDINIETLTSATTLEGMVREVGQRLIGMNVDPRVMSEIVAELQSKERAQKLSEERLRRQFSEQGKAGSELDAFMMAISGQESGGDYGAVNASSGAHGRYQIMPTNWSAWAKMAGLPSNAPRTPENQDRVARVVMASYYEKYKNWRDVAIAWYAGEGVLDNPQTLATALNRNQSNGPTIRQYADQVMDRFNRNLSGERAKLEGLVDMETGTILQEAFDPLSEVDRAIRARQGVEMQEFGFAKNMSEFFSLLGGLPGVGIQ